MPPSTGPRAGAARVLSRARQRTARFLLPDTGPRWTSWIVVMAMATAIGVLVSLSDQVQRLEWALADRFVRVATRVPRPPDDLVVVAIDELSFRELQRPWPWPRRLHAALIDALVSGGARAIVFDILFDAPSPDPVDDTALADAIARAGHVVLAADRVDVQDPHYVVTQWSEPQPALAKVAAGVGAVSLPLDPDGVVRHATLSVDGRPSLAVAALAAAGAPLPSHDLRHPLIAFRGPPRQGIRTVSYYQALDAQRLLPEDAFRGKVVFIGLSLAATPDAQSAADALKTPVAPQMAGVEVHASIADTLLRRRLVADPFAGAFALAGLCAVAGAAVGALAFRAPPFTTGLAAAAAAAVLFAASYLTRRADLVRLPVLSPLATAGVVYAAATAYRYTLGTRERRLLRNAFEHYVAPVIVRAILRDPSRLSLAGEEYDVSIVFTDLEGFTTLAERLPAVEVRAHLSGYLEVMTDLLIAEHATLDRFIGDAILAYFGCPVRDDRHPVQACRAVLAMDARMQVLNDAWARRGLPRLRMRIGVNSGRVVAGNMGTRSVFHYTIVGDAVNLASRLEGVNKEYGTRVLLSEHTWQRLGGQFAGREVDRVCVKGRTEAISIYEPAGDAVTVPDALKNRLATYEAGLRAYRARRWADAIAAFDRVLADAPGDGPARVLRERCLAWQTAPPAAAWDGVHLLASK